MYIDSQFPLRLSLSQYQLAPTKEWVWIYPPILPPPNFFDIEEEVEELKILFKKDNIGNPLYDETGKANLPVDEKGVLILDPESRTRLVDVMMEWNILYDYRSWINSATGKARELGDKQTVDWLRGLKQSLDEDWNVAYGEWNIVTDEERKKRGLTDWATHATWYLDQMSTDAEVDEDQTEQSDGNLLQAKDNSSPADSAFNHGSYQEDNPSAHSEAVSKGDEQQTLSSATDLSSSTSSVCESERSIPAIDLVTLWW